MSDVACGMSETTTTVRLPLFALRLLAIPIPHVFCSHGSRSVRLFLMIHVPAPHNLCARSSRFRRLLLRVSEPVRLRNGLEACGLRSQITTVPPSNAVLPQVSSLKSQVSSPSSHPTSGDQSHWWVPTSDFATPSVPGPIFRSLARRCRVGDFLRRCCTCRRSTLRAR